MQDQPVYYDIVVQGHIEEKRAAWFDGVTIKNMPSGHTELSGLLRDQAQLHGILNRIRDLGLTLIEVRQRKYTLPDSS